MHCVGQKIKIKGQSGDQQMTKRASLKEWFSLTRVFVLLGLLFFSGYQTAAQEASKNIWQVDPFYLKQFEEGLQAFNLNEFEEAFQSFKIAAFGLLDEPDLLGEALVYLTLCAYNLKKPDQVEYYLKEISRFKLADRIPANSRLPGKIKEQFARIQSQYKNGLTGRPG